MLNTQKSVLVIGSLNMDLVARVDNLPTVGETIFGKTFTRFHGGKGANQAIAAARMGAKVSMVGCVGDDYFGRELLSGLSENGVEASGVRSVSGSSGTALITVDEHGANTIVVVPGANSCVTLTDIDAGLAKFTGHPGILLLQHEIPDQVVRYAIEAAKAAGWLVILNPAPARELSPSVMHCVDIIIPNETEAEVLCGQSIRTVEDAASAGRELLAMGVGAVVITMGRQGALYCTREHTQHIPALPVNAIDSTAAGDSFAGTLACAVAQGRTLEASLRIATAAAALSVTRSGAQPSLPWREELEESLF